MNCIAYPSSIERITDKAILCRIGDDLFWLPRRHIKAQRRTLQDGGIEWTEYRILLPYWLAANKGLLAKDMAGCNVYPVDIIERGNE